MIVRGILAAVLLVSVISGASGVAAAQPDGPPVLADTDGDGIPDIAQGESGEFDDLEGASTLLEFLDGTEALSFDFDPDAGSSLQGPCGGWVMSYDRDGTAVDFAMDPGSAGGPIDASGNAAFTASNPFVVDPKGKVLYAGFTEDIFLDHRWEITVQGIGLDSGGDDNADEENHNAGESDLGDTIPLDFSALVKAEGHIEDNFGAGPLSCVGEGWIHVKSATSPFLQPPGIVASLLFLAGFSGLIFNARPAKTWSGSPTGPDLAPPETPLTPPEVI